MSQFRIGRASVVQGEQSVTFQDAVIDDGPTVAINQLFSFQGENVWYQIQSVAIANGQLQSLVLKTPYGGASKSAQSFAIQREFSQNLSLPLIGYGDVNSAGLNQISMSTLDAALAALGQVTGPIDGTVAPFMTVRKNLLSPLSGRAGLRIHREGQPALEIAYTGDESWKRWSFGAEDIQTLGKLAVGRGLNAGEALGVAGNGRVDGNFVVGGNLTILGDWISIDVSNLEVEDAVITVGKGNAGAAPYLGVKFERGETDAFLVYDESVSRFRALSSPNDLATAGALLPIEASQFVGPLTGNADSASRLATARTIAITGDVSGSGSFDGSSNFSLNVTLANSGVGVGIYTRVTVDAKGRVISGGALQSSDVVGALGFTPYRSSDAASANVAGRLVIRDASGNFAANGITAVSMTASTFTGDLVGTAQQAGRLAVPRSIALSGEVNGTVNFDGTNNVSITTTLSNSGVVAGNYANLSVDGKGRVTSARSLNFADITGALSYTPLSTAGGSISGSLTITGNLTVQGTLTQLNTNVIEIDDPIITVAKSDATGVLPYAGIKVEHGANDQFLVWENSTNRWSFYTSNDDLAANRVLAPVQASQFIGALSGNATTATRLQTARTINGVSFDGSANISFNSDAVAEGATNRYYTDARARAAISVGAGLTYNNVTGQITLSSTSPVLSVAGRSGAVVLTTADIGGLQTALDEKANISGATFTGNLSVRSSASTGSVSLGSGTVANPGQMEFRTADDVRRGYIGSQPTTSRLGMVAEAGWGWDIRGSVSFDTLPTFNGQSLLHVGSTAFTGKADLAGAVFTGSIAISRAVADGSFYGARVNGVGGDRWLWGRDGAAESSGNVGSNWALLRYSNTGSLLGTPISVNRATGAVTFEIAPSVGANTVWHAGNLNPSSFATAANPNFSGNASFAGQIFFANGGRIWDQSGLRTIIQSHNDQLDVLNQAGTLNIFSVSSGGSAPLFRGNEVWHANNFGRPQSSTGNGQWSPFTTAANSQAILPAGGRWAYMLMSFNASTGGHGGSSSVGVAAGGTSVGAASSGWFWSGFVWKIE